MPGGREPPVVDMVQRFGLLAFLCGTLLAVHWRHPVADHPRSGDNVHQVLAACPGLSRLVRHTEPDFLAEVYIRADGTPASVVQATGLV